MLKDKLIAPVAIAALIAAPATIAQQESAGQEIVRLEREMTAWQAARNRKEPMPHRLLYAEDWSGVTPRGAQFNKAQILALIESSTFSAVVIDDLRVRVYGDAAVATVRLTFSGTFNNVQSTDAQTVFTNTWIRKDGRWQQVAAHATRVAAQ